MPSGIYPRTEFHKQRISETNAKYWAGKKRPSPSAETKKKVSESMKGKNTWMSGKKHTSETKLKMSEIHRKENLSIETRIKLSESHKESKSPFWKGGKTKENHTIRNNVHYKIWREAVYKRDKYTCQECGDNKGGNLNAHHIKPFSLYPELRFEICNGLTLCISCHKKTDSYMNRKLIWSKIALSKR